MKPWLALSILLSVPAVAAPKPPKPPNDPGSATSMLRHYVKAEKKLASATTPRTVELISHWQELHALRIGLVRLEKRGDLKKLKEGRRMVLRHALAQLLGEQNDIAVDNDAKIERAHSQRTEDLFSISEVARRAFDIATADVNGTWSPG
jgi:hypothetical protein